ncbi:MAG: hypothetical protein PHX62_01325 [Bacilli bacterium]|nr:hypothetical protein [Bacilli bacterium]
MKYSVLIANIDNIEAFEDRALLQKLLISSINFLNLLFKTQIQTELTIKYGNIQGIFKNNYNSFLYLRLLANLLYPLKLRAGISYGNLNKIEDLLENAREARDYCFNNDCQLILQTENETDKYLNMLFLIRTEVKKEPSIPANLVQLFSEFLFPLFGDFNILKRQDMVARLALILQFKAEVYDYLLDNPKAADRDINFERNSFPDIDYVKYAEYLEECNLVQLEFSKEYQHLLNSFWKKGFSTKVSAILGITRQIIDRNYRYLNFNVSRNLDATIVYFLKSKE